MKKKIRISGTLSVGHNSPEGRPHGHSYVVKVTYRFGADARALKAQVETVLAKLDHTFLPDELALAENLAEHIGKQLPGCVKVKCDRPIEGICGSWKR